MVWGGRIVPEVLQDPELRRNRKTSGSMPDSLSAGEFLKRSTALHDIVPVWCIWWQKLFKKVTREQQIMGGGERVVLCGGSKIELP